jgi:Spy/CpxP family protein refolding chaperone
MSGVLALVTLLFLGPLPASAQQGLRNRAGMTDLRNSAAQLNLTEEQLGKINDIIKAEYQDVCKLLTPEQQQKLNVQLATQQGNLILRVGAIKLTDAQQPKVQILHDGMLKDLSDIGQPSGGAQVADQAQLQQQVRMAKGKYSMQLRPLLTPEQLTALTSDFALAYGKLQTTQMIIGLAPDRRTIISGICQNAAKQADTIRDDATLKADQQTAKMNDLYAQTVKQILDALTPELQKQVKDNLANQNQEPQINANPFSHRALNLSDDLQTQVRTIAQKAQQDITQVLTADQQQKLQAQSPARRNATPPALL